MKLRFDDIKGITHGAVTIKREKGGLAFYKCTDRQLECLRHRNPDVVQNATNSTGCRMDFITDSEFFSVTTAGGTKLDLYLNGVFTRAFDLPANGGEINVSLPKGENRVELIFASHDGVTVIKEASLSDGAHLAPHKYDMKLLFNGDSITQGWESGRDSLSYAWRVAHFFNADIINQGVGGSCYWPEFAERLSFEPDVVVVAYGTNDFSHYSSLEEIALAARGYLENMLKYYENSKIFVISPIWRADEITNVKPFGSFQECCAVIKNAISELPVTLIDGYSLTPHIESFYSDGYLHPNADGFGIYAESLIKAMQKELLK